MKKILFLLLITVSFYGQNPSRFAKIQITGNSNSGTATKVNVQEANGEVNTQSIGTAFNKNFGLNSGDVVGASTILNQYSNTPTDWTSQSYTSGSVVFYAGKQWIATSATLATDIPATSIKWLDFTFENIKTNLDSKANLSGGNNFTGAQSITANSNTSYYSLKPIRNQFASFFDQPFFESDQGYTIFRPYLSNLPSRFYIMPNGTPTGTTSKFEMFNTDYSADWTSYSAFNILMNNTTNTISIGSNRGSGGGTRQKLRIGGDFVGSSFTANASAIDFNTDNTININPFGGAISFGSALVDPFGLSLANEFSFKNFTTGQPSRLNIIGNGWAAGVYFGRDAIRTASIATQATTSDVEIAVNKANSGTALTSMIRIWGATGNVTLQDGGTHVDDVANRLKITGTAISQGWKTSGGASTDYVTGTGSLINFNSGVRTATLIGYTSGAGVISASDTVLQAIQKLNGNDALKAPLASPTFTGTVTVPNGVNPTDAVNVSQLNAVGASGSYTPTLTASSNITSLTLNSAFYTKVGNVVTARITVTFSTTSGNTFSSFTFTLPVNKTTSTSISLGNGNSITGSSVSNSVDVVSTASINTATASFISGAGSGANGKATIFIMYDITQ